MLIRWKRCGAIDSDGSFDIHNPLSISYAGRHED
jgi:hypothetical protein